MTQNRLEKWLHTSEKPILMDGAMGTCYAETAPAPESISELANLTDPQTIYGIHRQYIEAGAVVIRANTFSVNPITLGQDWAEVEALLEAGLRIAEDAAANTAKVLASIGPVSAEGKEKEIYLRIARHLISLGAEGILFETFESSHELVEIIPTLRKDGYPGVIGATFAVMPDGYTMNGESAGSLIREMNRLEAEGAPDFVGFNCTSGPLHLRKVVEGLKPQALPLAVLPNAGYPATSRGHVHYGGTPEYFADEMLPLRDLGVALLGGCCGTTPAHIQAMKELFVKTPVRKRTVVVKELSGASEGAPYKNTFREKLEQGERPIAVEYDSPSVADFSLYGDGVRAYKAAGVDAITIADCPIGRARMDSSLVALLIKKEFEMEAIPHLTCRDRNLNALKALLLGLNSQGIYNQIVVTGDPIPTAQRDEIRSVYNFNSEKLTRFISAMNEDLLEHPLTVSAAVNVNAKNFTVELRRAKQKAAAGAYCFFTQPVHSQQAIENLQILRENLDAKIMGGIMPVVSERNARFMVNELSGMVLDPVVYEGLAGLSREEAEDYAYEVSVDYCKQIAPFVDGFYLMTPFNRTELIVRIVRWIQEND